MLSLEHLSSALYTAYQHNSFQREGKVLYRTKPLDAFYQSIWLSLPRLFYAPCSFYGTNILCLLSLFLACFNYFFFFFFCWGLFMACQMEAAGWTPWCF
ncbi:hypothetical protein IscW_ISCW014330 [Ixodes scapularis]|uniref:Uncharacterized protein n=1 Tax=Ixodes scapularis TaxID=6945 RepID=B7QIX5_IXOSC|nr:hypothetical protein IscW_ISCW014330 [Ixodes scapularis]|eukprot:XP_002415132.1 hypothetical protein IscW_ISCW014330 [Ixodes scapularis]